MEDIKVVYITDDEFAMPTTISITSLIMNKRESERLKIYVFINGVSDYHKKMLKACKKEGCEIEIIDIQSCKCIKKIESKTTNCHVTPTAVYKFFLPQLLKDENKVLYIDGDTLIQNSLLDLYQYQLKDCYIAAVNDFLMNDKYERVKPLDENWKRDIGKNCPNYFNSGVMLLNIKKMREDQITEKMIEYRNNAINYYMDQDAFNMICSDNFISLDSRFNFQTHLLEWADVITIVKVSNSKYSTINKLLDSAIILHCCGSHKPWKYYLPWTTEVFKKYYQLSPYSKEPLDMQSLMALDYQKKKNANVKDVYQIENTIPKNLKQNGKIVLYGAGKIGHIMNYLIRRSNYANIVLWIDENYEEVSNYMNEDIKSVERIKDVTYDQVFITLYNCKLVEEIKRCLIKMYGVESKTIVTLEGIEH